MERVGLVGLVGLVVLAAAAPPHADDLIIQSAQVRGTRLHLIVRNDGDLTSRPLSVVLTTRAGGFMVGTAAHPLPLLSPGALHQLELPLPIWAPDRSDLLSVITQRGCCTTRVVLLPAGVAVEVSHLLPLPVGGGPPRNQKESP